MWKEGVRIYGTLGVHNNFPVLISQQIGGGGVICLYLFIFCCVFENRGVGRNTKLSILLDSHSSKKLVEFGKGLE